MNTITIDEEFHNLCPPITDSERGLLRESLNREGLISPLIVWNHAGKTILVDGHNRYEILQELERLDEIQTTELVFGTRENALNWVIKNQLGRRNLAPDAAALLRGKLYIAQRIPVKDRLFQAGVTGNPVGVNQHSRMGGQELPPVPPVEKTADIIGNQTGVSARTVKNDAKFAEAAEKLGIEKDIIAGKEKRSRKAIIQAATSEPKEPAPNRQERPLEEILAKRWEAFVKGLPVTRHSEVRLWLTNKLKESAL
jgi:ParB-like chromosome segregation protein Spo0J